MRHVHGGEWYLGGELRSELVYETFILEPPLHTGIMEFMYLFEQHATKLSLESVVESMGNIIKKHSPDARAPEHETMEKELFIDWNAPSAYTPAAERLINETVQDCGFKCRIINKRWGVSKVVDKWQSERPKLPFFA